MNEQISRRPSAPATHARKMANGSQVPTLSTEKTEKASVQTVLRAGDGGRGGPWFGKGGFGEVLVVEARDATLEPTAEGRHDARDP